MGKTWSEMKIEFVTWFKEGDRFRVIVKASASHQSTRWHGFARFVLCDEFETTKSSRYSNPMIQYKTSQNAVEIESHMIRVNSAVHRVDDSSSDCLAAAGSARAMPGCGAGGIQAAQEGCVPGIRQGY